MRPFLPLVLLITGFSITVSAQQSTTNDGTDAKEFKELTHRYKSKKYMEGKHRIEEVDYVRADSVLHRQVQYQVFCYLVDGKMYKSEIALDLPNWNYLLPLTKVFSLPDGSLGLVTFTCTGGPGHGPCGKASHLLINLRRVSDESSDIIYEIGEDECNQTVSIGNVSATDPAGSKKEITPSALKNISWDGKSLLVTTTLNPGRPDEKKVPYRLNFAEQNGTITVELQ